MAIDEPNTGLFRIITKAAHFAAHAHREQRRKDRARTPYFNHLAEVADLLAFAGADANLIAAGYLHDTIEDAGATHEILRSEFNADIAALVLGATDDKTLDKARRKALQVAHAAQAPPRLANLKLADKISNLRSMEAAPPADWSAERIAEYIAWAHEVVSRLPAASPALLDEYRAIRERPPAQTTPA